MGADKQLFAPVPLRAMRMELSGLQLRVLICVAAHDRLSLPTGKGQGCRASNQRMQLMVGCSFARLCSTLTELVSHALLQREMLGRHSVYRVIYSDEDRLLFGNATRVPTDCGSGSSGSTIGCRANLTAGGKLPEILPQYIPLNGGRHSVETRKESSSEEARFAARGLSKMKFADNVGGQLARSERALRVGEVVDRLGYSEWLEEVADNEEDGQLSGWASRLSEQVHAEMGDDDECGEPNETRMQGEN